MTSLREISRGRTRSGSEPIPRILHQTWKTSHLPESWSDLAQSWREHHPDWDYCLWTDADNRDLVARHHPSFLAHYDSYSYGIQRADAARYLILERYGGLYVDLDVECLRRVDELLAGRTCVLVEEPAVHAAQAGVRRLLGNSFLACRPGEPFLRDVAEELRRRPAEITFHHEVLTSTGPRMLTEVYDRVPRPHVEVLEPVTVFPLSTRSSRLEIARRGGPEAKTVGEECAARGAVALHHWSNSWIRGLAGELRNPHPHDVPGFRFLPGLDSPGHDLGNAGRDVAVLAEMCRKNPQAIAFNTDGFLKFRLREPGEWVRIPNPDGDQGLYLEERTKPRRRTSPSPSVTRERS